MYKWGFIYIYGVIYEIMLSCRRKISRVSIPA